MANLIYIDPGHGGSDSGAVKYLVEKNVALTIAKYCDEFLRNKGIGTLMARTTDVYKSLDARIHEANVNNCTYYVSIHLNGGEGDGVETFYTINGGVGKTLATNILDEIVKLGQNSRGIKTKKGSSGTDYYAVIRQTNMPATIVECAFVDHPQDYKILDTDAECKAMGIAIAKGIIATLKTQGLYEDEPLKYRVHCQSYGWQNWSRAGETAGTVGEAKRMEAIVIDAPADYNLKYQVHVQKIGDMPLVNDGEIAGTVGQALRVESIRIVSDKPIAYRVHQQTYGWSDYVLNGEWAGVKGQSKRIEAIEIVGVENTQNFVSKLN